MFIWVRSHLETKEAKIRPSDGTDGGEIPLGARQAAAIATAGHRADLQAVSVAAKTMKVPHP